jgi:uncharacterized membrane protein YgcG
MRHSPRSLRPAARAGLVLLLWMASAGPVAAQVRAMYWPEISVEARLDADGRLHVSERWDVQFSGDYNGGERRWDLDPKQRVEDLVLVRIDPDTGQRRQMVEGDLDVVDGWDRVGSGTVRWRSRLPSDPPFQASRFVYQLDYVMTGVLEDLGDDRYRLRHQFGFAERDGIIGLLEVELSWDPVWRSAQGQDGPPLVERYEDLRSGWSPVTVLELTYAGEGRPAAVPHPLDALLDLWPFLLSLAGIAWLWKDFERHEADSGRYVPLPDLVGPPSRRWLGEHVFSHRAEVVGALWDRSIGQPEVSALLARLVAEGRLSSSTTEKKGKPILHLRLEQPRKSFTGYEGELIDGLFFDGRTETDTEAVRKHYKSQGFSPASLIQPELKEELPKPGKPADLLRPRRRWLTPILLVASAVLFAVSFRRFHPAAGAFLAPGLMLVLFFWLAGQIYAVLWRTRVTWPEWTRRLLVAPALFATALLAFLVFLCAMALGAGGWDLAAAAALLPVATASAHLYRARTREAVETVHLRRRLAHARDYFAAELGKDRPDLEDGWYPYLLALGLAKEVESWNVRSPADSTSTVSTGATGSFSGGGSSSPGWSGGGGSFGGAGASGAWTAAAAGLSAGVASPSSGGGSSGGGGGGGGSSGGGGGGGW